MVADKNKRNESDIKIRFNFLWKISDFNVL